MPRGDRTGPWGAGPMTGRATGYCAGHAVTRYMNPRFGYGRGYGKGRGRELYLYPPPVIVPAYPKVNPPVTQQQPQEQEVAALENYQKELAAEKTDIEKEMNDIKARIEELKTKLEKTKEPQTET